MMSYYKERVDAVRVLYGLVAALDDANNNLFLDNLPQWIYTDYTTILSNWLVAFEELYRHYSKNRILLLDKTQLSSDIQSKLNQLSAIRTLIVRESNNLIEEEEKYDVPLFEQEDLVAGQFNKFKQRIKSPPHLFADVREELESYFKTLTDWT